MRVLAISADNFEDSELTQPLEAMRQAKIEVDIASFTAGTITGKKGTEAQANRSLTEVSEADYDMLFLPGGKAPATLRKSETVQDLARSFATNGKPIAAICHGPQILISAGIAEGRTMTSYKSVASELQEAGAHYVDQALVTDRNFITSRQPDDLPVFIDKMLETLEEKAGGAVS